MEMKCSKTANSIFFFIVLLLGVIIIFPNIKCMFYKPNNSLGEKIGLRPISSNMKNISNNIWINMDSSSIFKSKYRYMNNCNILSEKDVYLIHDSIRLEFTYLVMYESYIIETINLNNNQRNQLTKQEFENLVKQIK